MLPALLHRAAAGARAQLRALPRAPAAAVRGPGAGRMEIAHLSATHAWLHAARTLLLKCLVAAG